MVTDDTRTLLYLALILHAADTHLETRLGAATHRETRKWTPDQMPPRQGAPAQVRVAAAERSSSATVTTAPPRVTRACYGRRRPRSRSTSRLNVP